MATITKYASQVEQSGSGIAWLNLQEATGEPDEVGARGVAIALEPAEALRRLAFSAFGFNADDIPADAVIVGVEDRIHGYKTAAYVDETLVRIIRAGELAGANGASGEWLEDMGQWFERSYGGPTDLRGLEWRPADLWAAGTGLVVDLRINNTLGDYVEIDSVARTVHLLAMPTEDGGSGLTATFDSSLATPKDSIRLILGDTDTANPLIADPTIEAMLSVHPYGEALAQLAESLIAEYGQRPSEYGESGGVRIAWAERISAWRRIADDARAGKIVPPIRLRRTRYGMAIQETAIQAQTPRTRRTDSRTPTLMEGFRTD